MSTSSAAAAGAPSGTPSDTAYVIKSLLDGCVIAVSGEVEPGATVDTGDPGQPPGAQQTWTFVAVEPGWWLIATGSDAGFVMTLDTDEPDTKPRVVVAPPRIAGRDSQLWSLVPTEKLGYWYIQSKLGTDVMDIEGAQLGPGVPIIGYARKYRGFENQAWGFAPVH